jgi:hypothetical protein
MQKMIAVLFYILAVALMSVPARAADQPVGTDKPKTVNPTTKTAPATPARPLQASPGFTFEVGPKNQLIARRAGGGLGASTDCGCSSQSGSCTLQVTGGVALCTKNAGDTCKDDCTFTTTVPSVRGGAIAR